MSERVFNTGLNNIDSGSADLGDQLVFRCSEPVFKLSGEIKFDRLIVQTCYWTITAMFCRKGLIYNTVERVHSVDCIRLNEKKAYIF